MGVGYSPSFMSREWVSLRRRFRVRIGGECGEFGVAAGWEVRVPL